LFGYEQIAVCPRLHRLPGWRGDGRLWRSAAARGLVTDPDWLAVFNFATVPLAMAALAFMAWVARQVGRAPGAWVRLAAGAVAGGAGGWSAGPLASTALVAAYAVAMTLHARREWTS
jgi:hypothetical protein